MAAKNRTKLNTPVTVDDAVANLYKAFHKYEAPKTTLDVCLACCMDEKLENEMRRLPLASLYRHHFYEYNDSAKSEVQPAAEIKYFIPRLFELIGEGVDLHHSTEIYLDRVGRVPASAFSESERRALDDFALAFFSEGLKQLPCVENSRFQRNDAITVLLMFEIGGFDISPLLAQWLSNSSEYATLHYAHATLWEFWLDGGEVGNAFAGGRDHFRAAVKAWIMEPKNRATYAQRIVDCVTKLSDDILESNAGCCRTHKDVLDEVFQYVAE